MIAVIIIIGWYIITRPEGKEVKYDLRKWSKK
jgi:hypothetical protein